MKTKAGRRRLLFWGGVGLIVVVLIALSFRPRPVPVDLAALKQGRPRVTLDHEGKTRVRDRYEVSAPVGGRVLRINLEPGDPVKANDTILASFQPSDPVLLDARTRAEAEATIKHARAALERARAERQRALAQRDFAYSEFVRHQDLSAQGISSKQALDSARAESRAANESLLAAESAIRAAQHDLEGAQARLIETSTDTGGQKGGAIILRSPVDGVVLKRIRQSEAIVLGGEPLIEVADLADLEVIADFLSTDAVKIQPGMPVIIDQWGGEDVLKGHVRRVEPSGFMKVSALGVEEQRVWVVVDFDDPFEAWQSLGDEYRVEVRVIVWERANVLKAPTSSLFRHGDGWAVFVFEQDRAVLRPVELGRRNGLEAEVLSGVKNGIQVVVHPSDTVADGIKVQQRH